MVACPRRRERELGAGGVGGVGCGGVLMHVVGKEEVAGAEMECV